MARMAQVAAERDDPADWLRLIRSRRVGAVTFHRLMAEHGSARAALAALPDIARAAGVEDYAPCPEGVALAEMRSARAFGAKLLLWGGPDYPAALMDLPDAPPILWARGELGLLARPMVAMVGARNASSLGLRMARRLAEGLGQGGQVVVSGLARGIDTAAHEAALETGTVAVLAGGIDVTYPEENAELARQIAARGVIVSEQPMGLQPQTRHFPLRNRIISGLSRAVVVVEAAARSGSLITARDAADQGREVMAVPGHPFDARAAGCNQLLRDGATLVRHAGDVAE
ncbi:MAG: DNA-protecting protein DprA, partial [Pseudorhodobacter sp.]